MVRKYRKNKNVETEYSRRGVIPTEAGRSLLHDRNGLPVVPKVRQNRRQMPNPNTISNDPIMVKGQPGDLKDKPPHQPFAHVGVHRDKMWFDDNSTIDTNGRKPPHGEIADTTGDLGEGYYVDTSCENLDPLDPNQKVIMNEVDYQTPLTAEGYQQEEQLQEEQLQEEYEEQEDIVLNDMQPLEYSLIIDDDIILINRDLVVIKESIQNLMFNHDIELSRIRVFKRIPIDFGIIVGD
jgi:hypothetical protein